MNKKIREIETTNERKWTKQIFPLWNDAPNGNEFSFILKPSLRSFLYLIL